MRMRRTIRWAVLLALAAAFPANAGPMRPQEAKRFVAGKLFSYSCFDGTRGVGRIYADGAVVGTMQPPGKPTRVVAMPMGTIRVTSTSICASLRGALFEPCFDVVQTSSMSFRGSVSGLGFAVFTLVMAIVGVFILSLIIDALAPSFGGQKDSTRALKVAVYSYTPAWVAAVFNILPLLGRGTG